MTIPELGTIRATHPPVIVLTSNRTRDLHDAVKRRCLYHWIDYPTPQREVEIVRRRVKGASETLAVQVADAVSRMRDSDVQKPPGIAEAIDWLAALALLGIERARRGGDRPHARLGAQVRRGPGGRSARPASSSSCGRDDRVRRRDDRARPAAAGGGVRRRLHDAGVPVTPERAVGLRARAGARRGRSSRRRLYWTARAVFVSDQAQVAAFDRVFADVFGARGASERRRRHGGRVAAPTSGQRAPVDVAVSRRRGRSRARATTSVDVPGRARQRRGAAARASASTRSSPASSRSSTG